MKFSIKDLFSKCDQIRSFLRIWLHLLKKSLMENFIFCAVVASPKCSQFLLHPLILEFQTLIWKLWKLLLVYSMILLVSTKRCFKENKQISSKVKLWISIEKCSFLNQWQELLIAILIFFISNMQMAGHHEYVFTSARPCCSKQEINWK